MGNAANEVILVFSLERIAKNHVTCILKVGVKQFMDGGNLVQVYGASVKNTLAYKLEENVLCVVEIGVGMSKSMA